MSKQRIRGTHQFLNWFVCNRCGAKWDRRVCHCAEIRAHLADCQPDQDLAATTRGGKP